MSIDEINERLRDIDLSLDHLEREYRERRDELLAIQQHWLEKYDDAYRAEFGTGSTGTSPGYSEACGVWN